jgi:hypothetical protein
MLDPHSLTQCRVDEGCNVASSVDIRRTRGEMLVDDDSIVDGKPDLLGKLDVWQNPDPGHDCVDGDSLGICATLIGNSEDDL